MYRAIFAIKKGTKKTKNNLWKLSAIFHVMPPSFRWLSSRSEEFKYPHADPLRAAKLYFLASADIVFIARAAFHSVLSHHTSTQFSLAC